MIGGNISKKGVKGLGGKLPGQVHFGEQGPPGGHYIPDIRQIGSKTAEVSFNPSRDDMPAVDPVTINLPVGTGEVDLSGYATKDFVSEGFQEKGDYLTRSGLTGAINTALNQAKESGEFQGDPGYTPQKYRDYFTPDDQNEFVDAVIAALPVYDGEYELV